MRQCYLRVAAFSISLLLCISGASLAKDIKVSKPERLGFSSERLERLESRMQEYIDSGKLSGISTLIARNGKVAHFEQYGLQDREGQVPMREDTIFRIYSMTKPVTAVAALQLWEQGKFHMHDPIQTYLPEMQNLKVYISGSGEDMLVEDQQRPITVKDLFLHTSGLSYGFNDNEVDKLYRELQQNHPDADREQILELTAGIPLQHQPGEAWTYGINTDMLGFIVERIAGMRLGDYMQKHIFAPLGMQDTGFYISADKAERLAKLYTIDPKTGETVLMPQAPLGDMMRQPKVDNGGGGLVSTMADYLKFTQMLLDGGKYKGGSILSPRTVAFMRSNHLPNHLYPFEATNPGNGHALAMRVVVEPEKMPFMSSKGNYGWGGLASTFFVISPQENMVMIAMTQLIPSGFHPYQNDFRNLVYQAMLE